MIGHAELNANVAHPDARAAIGQLLEHLLGRRAVLVELFRRVFPGPETVQLEHARRRLRFGLEKFEARHLAPGFEERHAPERHRPGAHRTTQG